MDSNTILSQFIDFITKVENQKNKQICFGEADMLFYRREIHIIWAIDNAQGIHSSEIARKFGVTRAVTAKIIKKLTQQGYLYKIVDEKDKKCEKLYLTQRGQDAAKAHALHHSKVDQPILEYLESLNEEERKAVFGFLNLANHMNL